MCPMISVLYLEQEETHLTASDSASRAIYVIIARNLSFFNVDSPFRWCLSCRGLTRYNASTAFPSAADSLIPLHCLRSPELKDSEQGLGMDRQGQRHGSPPPHKRRRTCGLVLVKYNGRVAIIALEARTPSYSEIALRIVGPSPTMQILKLASAAPPPIGFAVTV